MNKNHDVRCPFETTNRYGQKSVCNKLTVRVEAGSSGEAYCNYCRKNFHFSIEKTAR